MPDITMKKHIGKWLPNFNCDHTSLGTKPKLEKNIISELEILCKIKMAKLTDINVFMASVKSEGL